MPVRPAASPATRWPAHGLQGLLRGRPVAAAVKLVAMLILVCSWAGCIDAERADDDQGEASAPVASNDVALGDGSTASNGTHAPGDGSGGPSGDASDGNHSVQDPWALPAPPDLRLEQSRLWPHYDGSSAWLATSPPTNRPVLLLGGPAHPSSVDFLVTDAFAFDGKLVSTLYLEPAGVSGAEGAVPPVTVEWLVDGQTSAFTHGPEGGVAAASHPGGDAILRLSVDSPVAWLVAFSNGAFVQLPTVPDEALHFDGHRVSVEQAGDLPLTSARKLVVESARDMHVSGGAAPGVAWTTWASNGWTPHEVADLYRTIPTWNATGPDAVVDLQTPRGFTLLTRWTAEITTAGPLHFLAIEDLRGAAFLTDVDAHSISINRTGAGFDAYEMRNVTTDLFRFYMDDQGEGTIDGLRARIVYFEQDYEFGQWKNTIRRADPIPGGLWNVLGYRHEASITLATSTPVSVTVDLLADSSRSSLTFEPGEATATGRQSPGFDPLTGSRLHVQVGRDGVASVDGRAG